MNSTVDRRHTSEEVGGRQTDEFASEFTEFVWPSNDQRSGPKVSTYIILVKFVPYSMEEFIELPHEKTSLR